ncbi:phage baseplate protein [Achromobacter sp. NPDC008082]|uniref:phage baseplate protein n=1 Tax=Achromobacter sp. NPDC008082 TaxID=3363888 RepID=UPI0036E2E2F5
MSFVAMIFGWNGGTSIGAVPLDALLSEKTSLNSRATDYAVEDGPPVTDHVVQESELLTLDGWVTAAEVSLLGGLAAGASTAIRAGGSLAGLAGSAGRSKLISAKDALRKIHADRLPITVTTGLDVYVDFVMERCEIGRTNEGGDRFEISADFKKIRKVALRQADIPPEKTSGSASGKAGQTKTNAGKTNGTVVTPKQKTDLGKLTGRGI